jgi:hypothetical protein
LRVDAGVLANLGVADLERGMQVSDDNPLGRDDGRADLLRRLGRLVASKPEIFGQPRHAAAGGLFRRLAMLADGGKLPAPTILTELPAATRTDLAIAADAGRDCARRLLASSGIDNRGCHQRPGAAAQALAMAGVFLIEPLADGPASDVTDIDGLTGLAEYRNGGLFVDSGVLAFRDAEAAQREHEVASPLVVEWRALTVALLDRVADGLRQRLGRDATSMPLAKILEGGTGLRADGWRRETPGRRVASGESCQRRYGLLDPRSETWTALRSLITRWYSTS